MEQQKRKRNNGKNKNATDVTNTDKKELIDFKFEANDVISDSDSEDEENEVNNESGEYSEEENDTIDPAGMLRYSYFCSFNCYD